MSGIKKKWCFLDRKVRKRILISILVGVSSGVIEYVFVIVLQLFLLSIGIMDESTVRVPFWVPKSLEFTLGLLLLAGFVRSFATGAKIYLSRMVTQHFLKTTRSRLVSSALNQESVSTSKVLSLFSDEANRAGAALTNLVTGIIATITGLVLVVALFSMAPIQTLLGLGAILLFGLLFKLFVGFRSSVAKDITSEWRKTNESLINSIRNHFLLTVYGVVEDEEKRCNSALARYLELFRVFIFQSSVKFSAPLFLGTFVVAVLSLISVKVAPLEAALLLSFLYLFMRLVQTLGDVLVSANDFRVNGHSLMNVISWLESNSRARLSKKKGVSKVKKTNSELSAIVAKDLGFSYDESVEALFEKINFRLNVGELLLIKGASGAGKSTLLSIILGLKKPTEGVVDFVGVGKACLGEMLESLVGYVGPTPFITEGTIRDNLLFGHPNKKTVSDADLWRSLEIAEVDVIVRNKKLQLDALLDEAGTTFSTGQKQRLSWARAILRNPKVFVMDEASSNLDLLTEGKILENLRPYFKEMIVVAVSHRNTYDSLASKVICL